MDEQAGNFRINTTSDKADETKNENRDTQKNLADFLKLSKKEHVQLTNLCNTYAQLTHSMEASSTYSSYYQNKQTYNLLIEYNKVLKQVQHSHSEMLRLLSYFSLVFNKQVIHVLQEHVNLGKRVIHTCTSDCYIDEYGIMRIRRRHPYEELSSLYDWKIIGLTTLQTSIQKLEHWIKELS